MSNRQQRKQNKMYRRMFKMQEQGFYEHLLGPTLHIDEQIIPPEDYIATSIEQLPKELQEKWEKLND